MNRIIMRTTAAVVLGAALAGCTGLRVEVEHTSHPFAGAPFGPSSEEDSLNTVNVVKSYEKGRVYVDVALGRKLGDGGFYGPSLTGTVRIGVKLDPGQ